MPLPLLAATDDRAIHVVSQALLVAGFAATAAWLLLALAIRIVRAPDTPVELPPSMDLGPESPAVANLVTNEWKSTPEAVPGTLLDLSARGYLEFQQVQPGQFQCRVRREDDAELVPYERRVLGLLRQKARHGVVPTEALTTGPDDAAERWWKGFRKEVVGEAKARGLSEDLWNPVSRSVLVVGAFVPAILFGIAIPVYGAVYSGLFAAAVTGALWGSGRQRSTPAGIEAAARWLAVREHLRQDSVFDTLPPTAVITWERYLGYGAALGQAAGAARPIAMGAESDHRAWSSVGGRWRQVKVVYPGNLASPGWGRSPAAVAALSLLAGGAAYGIFVLAGQVDRISETASVDAADKLRTGEAAAVAFGLVVAFFALVQFLRAVVDLFAKREITGLVLRSRVYGSDERPQYYVAVDDDSTDRVRAWRIRHELFVRAPENGYVTGTVTRNLRYVRDLQLAPAPTAGPASVADGFTP